MFRLISGEYAGRKNSNQLQEQIVPLDPTIISKVFENLLSNALRYAKIEVSMSDDEETATNVYYHNNSTDDPNHFGLGLDRCHLQICISISTELREMQIIFVV